MLGSSEDTLDQMRTREVTGVFHSRKALIDAAETLLGAGIARADIDVSASVDDLDRRLNCQSIPAADLADPPLPPRRIFRRLTELPSAETVAGGIAGCLAAIAAAAILAVHDAEPLYVGLFAIISGVIVGGIAVTRVHRRRSRAHALGSDSIPSEWHGLLIWARVRSPKKEAEAREILTRHGGQAVHVHEIELAARSDDVLLDSLRGDAGLGHDRSRRP